MDGEIVVERRRQWTPEQKAALLRAGSVPAASSPSFTAPQVPWWRRWLR